MFKTKKRRIAINGFGRIGRAAFKIALENKNLEVVAINDLTDPATLAWLLKRDTVYGEYEKEVAALASSPVKHITASGALKVDKKIYPVLSERDPELLPWQELKVDVVIESTGVFCKTIDAKKHITAGARGVVISAPAKDDDSGTYILGVNTDKGTKGEVISNASCTTNSISPVVAIVNDLFGVKKAVMTTIHSYTADQSLVDGPHKDLRRARAAAQNIVPTTTGAAIATTKTIPSLVGKFDGMAIRVPTPVGSISDITFVTKKKVTVAAVNKAFKNAAKQARWQGILAVTEEPLVSSDIIGSTYSSIVDLGLTQVVDGDLLKIFAWYDNEWGYSNRLVEMVAGMSI